MNRVGRLLICITGGLALSVIARADVTPLAPGDDAARRKAALEHRLMLLKEHQHHMPSFPGFSPGTQSVPTRPNLRHPGLPPASVATATAVHPNGPLAPAAANTASGNPYESIVTRNVFGLNPIPPPTQQEAPPGPPPPKITLTGIMTIFGPPEALFKVAGVVRGGGRPHDESYIFTEGEEQDEVEVTKIDTNKDMVSFMNHGVSQDIPLSDGVASGGSTPSGPSFPSRPGGPRPFGRFFNRPGGFQPQSFGGYHPSANNGSANNGSSSGFNNTFGGNNYGSSFNGAQPSQPVLSPDDQAAVVAAEHAQAVQNNSPIANLFPPTKYDQDAAAAAAGSDSSGANPGGATPPPIMPPNRR